MAQRRCHTWKLAHWDERTDPCVTATAAFSLLHTCMGDGVCSNGMTGWSGIRIPAILMNVNCLVVRVSTGHLWGIIEFMRAMWTVCAHEWICQVRILFQFCCWNCFLAMRTLFWNEILAWWIPEPRKLLKSSMPKLRLKGLKIRWLIEPIFLMPVAHKLVALLFRCKPITKNSSSQYNVATVFRILGMHCVSLCLAAEMSVW